MLHVHALTKSFGGQPALQSVSFQAAGGEIIGVFGPAGAGKTTLLKLLAGCLRPDAGSIHIGGIDMLAHPQAAQAQIGYLPAQAPAYPELSVQTHLRLAADLRGISPADQRRLLSQVVYAAHIQEHLAEPVGCLSHGLRRRVGLAQAILHRPPLLLLDDPLAGLAPDEAAVMRHLIRRLAHRSTVLLATPVPEEVEALCDRVLILLQGVVRADLRLAQLHATAGAILVLDAPVREAANCLLAMPGVRSIAAIVSDCGYPAYRVVGDDPHNLCPAIFALANANGWPLRELRPDHNTLRGALTTLGDLHTEHEPAIIHTT